MKLTKMDIYRKEQTTNMEGTTQVPNMLVVDALRVAEKYACRPCIRLSWGTCSNCQVSKFTDKLMAVLPAKARRRRDEIR